MTGPRKLDSALLMLSWSFWNSKRLDAAELVRYAGPSTHAGVSGQGRCSWVRSLRAWPGTAASYWQQPTVATQPQCRS